MTVKKPQWLGNGTELPLRTDIEYRFSTWAGQVAWEKTQVMFVGNNVIVITDNEGNESSISYLEWSQMICRPVGGLIVSEHADLLNGVTGVVEASSFEKFSLWKEWHEERKFDWDRNLNGTFVTVGYVDKRPVCMSLMVHAINNRRILFIEATSEIVDWAMITKWLERNLPKTAFRDNGYVNKTDASNFSNLVQ